MNDLFFELILGLVNVVTAALCFLVFVHPLSRKDGSSGQGNNSSVLLRSCLTLLILGAVEPFSGLALNGSFSVLTVAAAEAVRVLLLGWLACRSCSLTWLSGMYAALWSVLISEVLHELPLILLRTPALERLHTGHFLSAAGAWQETARFFVLYYILRGILTVAGLLFARMLAVHMSSDGTSSIGRRQLTSAITLGMIHIFVYSYLLSTDWMRDLAWPYIMILLLAQVYSLTILYIQNELFRRSEMRRQMDTVNALLARRRQQYEIARQNVQLINRRVHDLKLLVASLEKSNTDAQTRAALQKVQEATGIYNAVIKTGNDVLDTVLTDKSLFCEAHGIRISAVADGPALSFLETTDIYTIFNNILDEAIQQVSQFQDKNRRTIDLMIYRREQFLIINIYHPLSGAVRFRDGLPVPRNSRDSYHNYEMQAVRQVLRRYDGLLNCEEKNSIFTYRIVIPAV